MSRQVCEIEQDIKVIKAALAGYENELKQATEKHYHVGQWFKKNDYSPTIAVLAQVDSFSVVMMCFEKGGSVNRWHDPVKVHDIRDITNQEFENIAGNATWTVINTPTGVLSC